MKLSNAGTIEKLIKTAVRLLVNDHHAERAVVAFENHPSEEPAARGFYGLKEGDPWNDPTVDQEILRHVLRQDEPVFLVAAEHDDRFFSGGGFQAVACVPLHNRAGEVTGFLYADHKEKGALSYDLKTAITQMAQDFEARHRELDARQVEVKPELPERVGCAHPLVATAGILVLAFLTIFSLGVKTHTPQAKPLDRFVPPPASDGPRRVSQRFLEALRDQDEEAIEMMLSRKFKKRVEPFERWRKAGPSHLDERQVLTVQAQSETADVKVGVPGSTGIPVWNWRVVQQPDGWKIDAVDMRREAPKP